MDHEKCTISSNQKHYSEAPVPAPAGPELLGHLHVLESRLH